MEKYNFDIISKTLTITADFAENMNDPNSAEYELVLKLTTDFPSLTIAKKTHRSPKKYTTKSGETFNCNQFKNLTYERMEGFIVGLPNHENYLAEFKFLKENGSLPQHSRYAVVSKWFLKQFPDFRKNPLFYLNIQPVVISATSVLEEETTAKLLETA
ncbi:MAG: hypothetical protein IJA31_12580 [Clostridia bacterium]|nr:hypothetical protein [Clostridia bacterium]